MINYHPLLISMQESALSRWAEKLPRQIAEGLSTQRFGDLPKWYDAFSTLPQMTVSDCDFASQVKIGKRQDLTAEQFAILEKAFTALIPWRKGPYSLFDMHIDTEWRSDWKWERLQPHISSLAGRNVLDVGCGNGYHCWRMLGEGARRVIGIDPSPRFVIQFYMIKHFAGEKPVDVLPVGIEAIPTKLEAFDTTFSMGVLYHRRSPMDHLRELKDTLLPGGELILETLVIEGKLGETLVPEGRYAKMNNVWFLPSVPTLESWLKKSGFTNIRCVDINKTSLKEQRATDWMRFQSLQDFLDPKDHNKTVEGHPTPTRAIFIAEKP